MIRMPVTLLQYLKLTIGLIRYGRLSRSGIDFNSARAHELQKFLPFLQNYKSSKPANAVRSFVLKNPRLHNLIGQAAFIRRSLRQKGKHLYAPSLHLGYVRIPKAASTSLSLIMLEHLEPQLKAQKLNEIQINFLTDSYIQSGLPADTHLKFFTAVRNPFSRIVSVYRSFFETVNPFNFEDYLFGIFSKNLTFGQFIQRLSIIPDRLKDDHLKPQTHLLDYYYQKKVNLKVIRLEDTDELKSFLATYNLTVPLLNQSPEFYEYKDYFTPETADLVLKIYKRDVENFHYEAEVEGLQNYINYHRAK